MASPTVSFQAPTGTRDLYPADAARRRFIVESWRSASVRHGFDEVDGPTFEHLDLYTVKSGEGIVGELFSFRREGGEKDYALRPEFTPTLARLFGARAGSLPRPCRWFMTGPFFRAERPQRGRLREFLQWNADVIGDDTPGAEADVLGCLIGFLESVGLGPDRVRIRVSSRAIFERFILDHGGTSAQVAPALGLVDRAEKVGPDESAKRARELGLPARVADVLLARDGVRLELTPGALDGAGASAAGMPVAVLSPLASILEQSGLSRWCDFDSRIVRGLAYYTGMVFEATVSGERALAGGGRYDNLVELFGGPPTPAVGFGMGDAVLALVLSDLGLMPDENALLERAGVRPDAFVIPNGSPEAEGAWRAVVGALRRAGLHARHSSKATRNVGKLLQEAAKSGARFAIIVESGTEASLKDLRTGVQDDARTALKALSDVIASRARSSP